MLKVTGIRKAEGTYNDKAWTNYYVTAQTKEGIGTFNAVVYKLNTAAYEDTIVMNNGLTQDKWVGMYVDDGETKRHTNKQYNQIMFLRFYENDK